jgi:hypothetical protein
MKLYLLLLRVLDSRNELGDLIAHGLSRDTGGGSLEVKVGLPTGAGRVLRLQRHDGWSEYG